jgi:3-ketosteroid 9alpha-monooxygenase subunit B
MSGFHTLRVAALTAETADACSIQLDLPPALASTLSYRPGQFLTLRVQVGGETLLRCYSMSSTPGLDAGLRVTVKRVAGGRGSNALCDTLRAGDCIEVMPPAGVFCPPDVQGDFLLFAGGSGITPVFSILRAALAQGTGQVRLIYANRDKASIIFADALAHLQAQYPTRLHIEHWLDAQQGFANAAQLAALAAPLRHAPAYICGPAPFMDMAVNALQSLGLAPELIHLERFSATPTSDAAPSASELPELMDDAQLHIELDGVHHHIDCGPNETLLEAALRHKIAAPYSCQAGMCASCMCQVTEGAVHLRHNDALDAKDLARAWTLSCQAVPRSAVLRVKFP